MEKFSTINISRWKSNRKIAQKLSKNFVKFVHTFSIKDAIIIHVKPPNTLYIVFTNPIVKIPSPKKAAFESDCLFLFL